MIVRVLPRPTPWLLIGALIVALTACGSAASSDTSSNSGAATGVPNVVATMSIWADIVANVACDGLANVTTIIPPGGDPHSFEPSLRDRETMESADLIVANGLLLEESLADTIDAVESKGVPVLRVAEGLDPLPIGDAGDDHEGDADPHVWWDPTRVSAALSTIADSLAAAGIDHIRLDVCVDRYTKQLAALDDEVTATVAPLPVDERLLVTNHDSLGYFADRYDFTIIGTVIPSASSLAETNPAELDDLAAKIEGTGVPAIFAETQHSSSDTEALARRVGNVKVVTMATDTLGEPGGDTGTYLDWLAHNARTIVDALSPTTGGS